MYPVAAEQSDSNKINPVKGETLADIAASDRCEPGTTWQAIALYNWGTVEPHEVNRALIELVGCALPDPVNPDQSILDPDLGTTKSLHIPKKWLLPAALALEKMHTLKLRRRLPPPAVVLTKLDPWFIPETENCEVGYRVEGVVERADKIDFDVYASKYCQATPTVDDGFVKFTYADLDVPIRQKRAFAEARARRTGTISDWKGESEAADGMLKPRAGKKRYIDVACSPYTALLRYYKADADKDARISLKPFWPRFKKVFKDAADVVGIDGANADGLKGKTEAAHAAARELTVATRKAEADLTAFVASAERAALRAHSAAKAAARAVTSVDSAKTAADQASADLSTVIATAATAPDLAAKEAAAAAAVGAAVAPCLTAATATQQAADALAIAKAAAAQAKTSGDAAQVSATAAIAKAAAARTKADEAKAAAAAAPATIKDPATAAATLAEAAKGAADAVDPLATGAATSATTCSANADTAAATAASARDDAKAASDAATEARRVEQANAAWVDVQVHSDLAKSEMTAGKLKADRAKTEAETLQTAADQARIDVAKIAKALAKLKADAVSLEAGADATDNNVVFDASLKITWKIQNSAKVKHGQLLIVDKDGTVLFRKPLQASDLTQDTEVVCDAAADDQKKYWIGDKTKLHLSPAAMPYRAQLQAHSGWNDDDGVALAAMHTEVRLWAHKDNGSHADAVDDSPSLRFALAPWRPEKDPPGAGSIEWYKLKLAEAGYHAGPVNALPSAGPTDDYQIAMAEFQRSFPREEAAPFSRLDIDASPDAPNGPTQTVMARTDVADAALAKTVDVKAKTQAALDAANAAKVAAEKSVADAAAAETDAVLTLALADEALSAAAQALADAAAAEVALGTARTDAQAAATAQATGAADSAQRIATAQASARQAKSAATSAASSASLAQSKAAAAKDKAVLAANDSAVAKSSAADAATRSSTAKTAADEAKSGAAAAAADASVTAPVDGCVAKAATAETAANAAKASAGNADTAAAKGETDGIAATTSADTSEQDAAALTLAVTEFFTKVDAGVYADAVGAAASASGPAGTAKASAERARIDLQAFKVSADQSKLAADRRKTDADQAKTDADALTLAAKQADDAAEAERVKKAQRKADVDKVLRPSLAMFGNPAGRADYTLAQAGPLLGDKTKDLIVWLDDCSYYTQGASIPAIGMGDYRGDMSIGDGKVAKDKTSVPRPWIPLEVQLPLLGKGQALECSGAPPVVTDAMRRATGPLRVDWTFEELAPEVSNIPEPVLDVARKITALDRSVSLKALTAATLTAATAAKAAAALVAVPAVAAPTEAAALAGLVAELETLAAQMVADLAAAKSAAEAAAQDAAAAALSAANATADAGSTARRATASCDDAAAKAATAQASAVEAAAKAALTKAKADALATEAGKTKTETAKLVEKLNALLGKIGETDLAAGVASSAATVTDAVRETREAADAASKSLQTATTDVDTAATSAEQCKSRGATAETAFEQARSLAQALQLAAALAKGHADANRWIEAGPAATGAAQSAAEAKTAADQAKVSSGALKSSSDTAKPQVDQAKTAASKAKTDVDAVEPKASTADTAAEADRVSREAEGVAAAVNADPSIVVAQGYRPRAHVAQMLGASGSGTVHNGKTYTNCPTSVGGQDCGGIRPAALADYYKAPFGLDKQGSNRPWLAIDDTANKAVASVVHDDLGQDESMVFAPYLGKAGMFLNPSRIAGDGYRYRAQVSFAPLPAAAGHPNIEALLGRYPRRPSAHTAGLRLWRKASVRGYVSWMPTAVAGWEGAMNKMAAHYAAGHVHFVYEGPSEDTPMQFVPVGAGATDLISAADYTQCVDSKILAAAGPCNGQAAVYTAGYTWPYLDRRGWGLPLQATDLGAYYNNVIATLDDNCWDGNPLGFTNELIHKLTEGIEKKFGLLRGHLLAEYKSSPPVVLTEYQCGTNSAHLLAEVANDPSGAESVTVGTETVRWHKRAGAGLSCGVAGCGGTYAYTGNYVMNDGLPLCAVGKSLGACWLYVPRNADTWAHEVGHHRHLEHAQAWAGETVISPGGQVLQHDAQANDHQAAAASAFQKAWDRWCVMSYDKGPGQYFCGKCLLKNRGWAVEVLTDPATEVQDG